jgi:hypothetical protein
MADVNGASQYDDDVCHCGTTGVFHLSWGCALSFRWQFLSHSGSGSVVVIHKVMLRVIIIIIIEIPGHGPEPHVSIG